MAGGRPARILVYGVTGCGKTTLAAEIGARLGLPWHSVDELTWEPGWVQVPADVQRARIVAICGQPEWVLDTAYGAWRDVPMASADLVVGLDYPRWLSLARLVRRTIVRAVTRRPVCNGNYESIAKIFSSGSILRWHFQSFARKRQRMRSWHADPAGPAVVLFRSPRAVTEWLHDLPSKG